MAFSRCCAALALILILLSPLILIAISIEGASEAVRFVSAAGSGEPFLMRGGISNAFPFFAYYTLAIAWFASVLWIVKCREAWFYWGSWVVGILFILPFVPIGTVAAIFIIVHLVRNKHEYNRSTTHNQAK